MQKVKIQSAIVIGATGLIGQQLVQQFTASRMPKNHPGLTPRADSVPWKQQDSTIGSG